MNYDQTFILAKQIADDLFTNCFGEKAERLVLEIPGTNNGGAWSYDAVVARIVKLMVSKPTGLLPPNPAECSQNPDFGVDPVTAEPQSIREK